MYVAVPERDLRRVADEIAIVASANATLTAYHHERQRNLGTQPG
jgi:hypothetical protein